MPLLGSSSHSDSSDDAADGNEAKNDDADGGKHDEGLKVLLVLNLKMEISSFVIQVTDHNLP